MIWFSVWVSRLQSRPAHHDLSNFTVPYPISQYPLRVEWRGMSLLSDRAGAPHCASLNAELAVADAALMPRVGGTTGSHRTSWPQLEATTPLKCLVSLQRRCFLSAEVVAVVRCSACELRERLGDLTLYLWPSAEKGAECPFHPAS